MKANTDFVMDNYGSIIGITPVTPAARDWLDENCASEPWQWMGETLNVDCRCAESLLDGNERGRPEHRIGPNRTRILALEIPMTIDILSMNTVPDVAF